MAIERDDSDEGFEPWPAATDLINTSLLPVLEHIFAVTADGSSERAAALSEVLQIAERIRAALAPKPRLN
jgi:hypothetical protein